MELTQCSMVLSSQSSYVHHLIPVAPVAPANGEWSACLARRFGPEVQESIESLWLWLNPQMFVGQIPKITMISTSKPHNCYNCYKKKNFSPHSRLNPFFLENKKDVPPFFWVNDNISLTWKFRPFWDDSHIHSPWFQWGRSEVVKKMPR